jgi:hypothetical protein
VPLKLRFNLNLDTVLSVLLISSSSSMPGWKG